MASSTSMRQMMGERDDSDTGERFFVALEHPMKASRQRRLKNSVTLWKVPPTTIHEVASLDDYTDEERHQTWFTRTEFAEIKTSYRDLIHRMSQRECIQDTDNCSIRGLEGRSHAGSKNRQNIIVASIVAVLNEQDLQKSEGRNDPDTLAIAYRVHSYHSLQAACIMGRRDEAAIAEYTGHRISCEQQHLRHHSICKHGSGTRPHFHQLMTRPGVGHHLNVGLQGESRRTVVGAPASVRRPTQVSTRRRPVVNRRAAAA
jgi:hypothetical protein